MEAYVDESAVRFMEAYVDESAVRFMEAYINESAVQFMEKLGHQKLLLTNNHEHQTAAHLLQFIRRQRVKYACKTRGS
jgi:hypothetical protein